MSTFMKRSFLVALLAALLASCSLPGGAGTPAPLPTGSGSGNPYDPQPGDDALVRDDIRIVKTELLTLESYPLQFVLKVSFFMPTPCHQYRAVVEQAGADNRINVDVYSLRKSDQVCVLMALSTPTEVNLSLGSFATGHYTVWVNGEKAAEFDA